MSGLAHICSAGLKQFAMAGWGLVRRKVVKMLTKGTVTRQADHFPTNFRTQVPRRFSLTLSFVAQPSDV